MSNEQEAVNEFWVIQREADLRYFCAYPEHPRWTKRIKLAEKWRLRSACSLNCIAGTHPVKLINPTHTQEG
jgi:hypothetical protein